MIPSMKNKNYISVCLDDEGQLLPVVRKLRENNEIILDVLTPFPVHGLDEALSIKRSRIPVGGFIFGALGATLAFVFQWWVFTVSYPLIIGGKPFFSAPAFIPITFEVTILFAGLSMVTAMFIRSKMKPDIRFKAIDKRTTDDMFVILIDSKNDKTTLDRIRSILSGIRILEIR